MPLPRKLREDALVFATSLKMDLADLKSERQALLVSARNAENIRRLAEIADETRSAELSLERLSEYNPGIQGYFDCPYCWMIEGKRIRLAPMRGPIEAVTCANCAAHYQLER